MGIRFGIIAHGQPGLLRLLGSALAEIDPRPIVHVDAKLPLDVIRSQAGDGFDYLTKRFDIRWAGFNMVEATVAAIRRALEDPDLSRFVLLSDDALPIKPAQRIVQYLSRPGLLFLNAQELTPSSHNYARICEVFIPDSRIGRLRGPARLVDRYIDEESLAQLEAARHAFELKKNPPPFRSFKGSQWLALSPDECRAVLDVFDNDAEFTTWFRFSAVPDESYIHTILLNREPTAKLRRAPVMHVDWSRQPKPYTYRTATDIEALDNVALPFARKFTAEAMEAVRAVYRRSGYGDIERRVAAD